MSEYRYYEFQAIDRPLSEEGRAALRAVSTRARITATSFVNDYAWGNFKGDEDAWMDRYFGARLKSLHEEHARKRTLIERLRKAGL